MFIRFNCRYRPLCDSRQRNLRAGKLPFIRDWTRFALTLAGVGMSLLGGVEQVPSTRVGVHNTCPPL